MANKNNEITAIPEWLDVLLRNGAIVTISLPRAGQQRGAERHHSAPHWRVLPMPIGRKSLGGKGIHAIALAHEPLCLQIRSRPITFTPSGIQNRAAPGLGWYLAARA